MKTFASMDAAKSAFRTYLTNHDKEAHELRKQLARIGLAFYGAERLPDCSIEQASKLASALGIPIPDAAAPETDSAPTLTPAERIEAKRKEMAKAAAQKYSRELRADAEGRLFTVMAAYSKDTTFIIIRQGMSTEQDQEAFLSQHTDAFMILEPRSYIVADDGEFYKLRGLIVQENAGKTLGDITIRTIMKGTA